MALVTRWRAGRVVVARRMQVRMAMWVEIHGDISRFGTARLSHQRCSMPNGRPGHRFGAKPAPDEPRVSLKPHAAREVARAGVGELSPRTAWPHTHGRPVVSEFKLLRARIARANPCGCRALVKMNHKLSA